MFFELVTVDLVIADITLHNVNVFYELGVRDGVCPRGIFLVSGNKSAAPPFDIAADRSFDYDPNLVVSITDPSEDVHATDCTEQCAILAQRLSDAIAVDRQATGSPVYSHLPGLKPVDWNNIETPKAKYLNGLQSGWHGRIRTAQGNGQPGDIVTLAMNAPTRLHEARILYEAATALVALSRQRAAERILRDVIRLDPDNADAQIQLALVRCRVDKHAEAEQQLRQLSLEFRERPRAADSLGQVLRHLWHFSWRGIERAHDRRQKAKDAAQVAESAVRSFVRAHRADPTAYFAGFNALMLAYVLKQLGVESQLLIPLEDLKATVRYVAEHQRQEAIESGKYDNQFWATTTLAGIVFMEDDPDRALAEIEVACAIPAATSLQLQSFRQRLELLAELEVRTEFVQRALARRRRWCSCQEERTVPRRLLSGFEPILKAFTQIQKQPIQRRLRATLSHLTRMIMAALAVSACAPSNRVDQVKFESVYRASKRMEAPTVVGNTYEQFNDQLRSFATEVSVARTEPPQRKKWSCYSLTIRHSQFTVTHRLFGRKH